ncbi:hypothetical protein IIY24_00045 [Candidatus Saccharibacteria bacterium]|nr:hypothetical protein [Candidatus Saccharibacteria bacterium]
MKKHKGFVVANKKLVVVLGILGLIIVGLVVGILILNNPFGGNERDEVIVNNAGEVAFNLSEEISEKLADESDYGLEQAVSEYEEVYNASEGRTKVYIAIEYANFVYDYFADLDKATGILKEVEGLLGDDAVKINYYVTLRELYEESGNEEMGDYYNQKVIELLPDDVIIMEGEE